MKETLTYDTTVEVLDRCLCFHLQRVDRVVTRALDTALRESGLTSTQYLLLSVIANEPGIRIGDAGERMGRDRTTITALLKPLAKRGLVTIAPSDEDRRSRSLYITERGRDSLSAAAPAWRKAAQDLDGRLAPESADRLMSALGALADGPVHDNT